ncbi:MAG: glycoside hydrolase domain-containing protein, partial [Clostridia bacterium]
NSQIGASSQPLAVFQPIVADKNALSFTGKTAFINREGLIENVVSFFDRSNALSQEEEGELFYSPLEFFVLGQKFRFSKFKVDGKGRRGEIDAEGKSEGFKIEVKADVAYEGKFDYRIKITAERDIIVEDVSLNAYFAAPEHNIGFGKRGGGIAEIAPRAWGETPFCNSMYVGRVNCGARIKLKEFDAPPAYLNRFAEFMPEPLPQTSWDNFGKGRVSFYKTDEGGIFQASAGKMIFKKGKSAVFAFEIHLTPFKPLTLERNFDRKIWYKKVPMKSFKDTSQKAFESNLNHIMIGRGFPENRYIGYPSLSEKELKEAITLSRAKCQRILYQHTGGLFIDKFSEFFALKNIGGELLENEKATTVFKSEDETEGDITCYPVIPGGRAENYYAESINYLLTKYGIEGITAEDMSVTSHTAERVNRVIRTQRPLGAGLTLKISDCGDEGKHSLNDFTDILPFVDGVFVEAENTDPDYVLAEVSGILYGLTGENANGYLNPHLAMLFGIGNAYGTNGEVGDRVAQSVYELWDKFGLKNAKFTGYWDENNPVTSDKKEIYISCFIREGDLLAVVYNASNKAVTFDLGINPKLGYSSVGKKIYRPALVGLCSAQKINFNKPFYLKDKKGMFIVVSDKKI